MRDGSCHSDFVIWRDSDRYVLTRSSESADPGYKSSECTRVTDRVLSVTVVSFRHSRARNDLVTAAETVLKVKVLKVLVGLHGMLWVSSVRAR